MPIYNPGDDDVPVVTLIGDIPAVTQSTSRDACQCMSLIFCVK